MGESYYEWCVRACILESRAHVNGRLSERRAGLYFFLGVAM